MWTPRAVAGAPLMWCNNCFSELDGDPYHDQDGTAWCSRECWETDNSEAWVEMALTDWKE